MTTWDFTEASSLIADATEVLALHREVAGETERRNLVPSGAARRLYESHTPDFAGVSNLLEAQLVALPEIDHIRDTFERPLSTNQRWGLGDADLEPVVRRAELAYSTDAFHEIGLAQRDMDQVLEIAEVLGAERILWMKIGSGSTAVFAVILLSMIVRRRRERGIVAADNDLARTDVVLSV